MRCVLITVFGLFAIAGCGNRDRNPQVSLVGQWLDEPEEGDVRTLEFEADGRWDLVDGTCIGVFTAWYCNGPGDWQTSPSDPHLEDDIVLILTYDGGNDDTGVTRDRRDLTFSSADRFCVEQDLLGVRCFRRAD